MNRIRVAYRQDGPARFVSHLDILRVFERAGRRAGLPLAYTEGFNPRPRLTFAAPLPVGMSSAQEIVDIDFCQDILADELVAALARQMPGGLTILKGRKVSAAGPALMSVLDRALYTAQGSLDESIPSYEVDTKMESFLGRGEVFVERKTGKGWRRRDIRPGIRRLTWKNTADQIEFLMELQSGSRGNVRPDEVLIALAEVLPLQPHRLTVCRTAMLAWDGRLLWDC